MIDTDGFVYQHVLIPALTHQGGDDEAINTALASYIDNSDNPFQ